MSDDSRYNLNFGPFKDNFPELYSFFVAKDEEFNPLIFNSVWGLQGKDRGYSVPLFPSKEETYNFLSKICDKNTIEKFNISMLGDPFEAMIRAANKGAIAFEFRIDCFDRKTTNKILKKTKNRIIFPFLSEYKNLSNYLPNVIGSGSNFSRGIYLTKKGEKKISDNKLCLWENNEITDQEFISNLPDELFHPDAPEHDPFWIFEDEWIGIINQKTKEKKISNYKALVLYEKDSAVKEFCSPEGYYPIFTSKERAENFINNSFGGKWHVFYALNEKEKNNTHSTHSGFTQEDLKNDEGIFMAFKKIDNLYSHLTDLKKKHDLPDWLTFIINPRPNRHELHHGCFSETSLKHEDKSIYVKSVNGIWSIKKKENKQHITRIRKVNSFENGDTFFLSNIPFKFTQIPKSYVKKNEKKFSSEKEISKYIYDLIQKGNDPLSLIINDFDESDKFEIDEKKKFEKLEKNEKKLFINYYKNLSETFCLQYWNKVTGERGVLGKPLYFSSLLNMISTLIFMEEDDRQARINGLSQPCNGYLGFDGSKNEELENNIGIAYRETLLDIFDRVVARGYIPEDGLDISLITNKTFKSLRIDYCGFVKDALMTFIPSKKITITDLCECVGIPEEILSYLIDEESDEIHYEAEIILEEYIEIKKIQKLLTKTKIFLSTALFNFKNFNGNLLLDYAPISVQIVKALENELRVLVKKSLKNLKDKIVETEDEKKLMEFITGNDTIVSLGFLGRILRKCRNSEKGPLRAIKEFILNNFNESLLSKDTIKIIENDALFRFRNGGAHDKKIDYSTCKECIHSLIGTKENPGILIMFQK